jgi:hypothetical protein
MKPYAYVTEEGEQVIEWIGEGVRFSLWFGGGSSWTYVTKEMVMECGDLSEEVINALKNGIRIENG